VIYAALTFVAFNRLRHLYDSPAEVFRSPYDRRIEKLLDGSHLGIEVVKGTPGTVDALLTPKARAAPAHPTGGLAAALRLTDGVCAWTPKAPIRLYYAKGDEQAVTANSDRCLATLRAHGTDAPLTDLGTPMYGGSRHLGSNQAATATLVRWFASLQSPGPGRTHPVYADPAGDSFCLIGRPVRAAMARAQSSDSVCVVSTSRS
jgi:hypothetical protein